MLGQIIHSLRMLFVAPMRLNAVWMAAAGLAIAAGSALMSYSGGKKAEKAAKEQAAYQNAVMKEQAALQAESIAASKEEARHKSGVNLHDTTVAFMKERARAVAGAGEAGVTGGSIQRTLADKLLQESDVRGREMFDLNSYLKQADRDIRGVNLGLASNVNKYKGVSSGQLALNTGLSFAADALSIYKNYSESPKE